MTWHDLYGGDLQGLYGLITVPLLFLMYRLVRGRPRDAGVFPAAARFVDGYAIVFAAETIIDPLVGGPLMRGLGLEGGLAGTIVMVVFVLLGDFRVYLLVFGLIAIAAGRRWTAALASAAGWTTLVPLVAYALNALLHHVVGDLNRDSIWLLYESLFAALAIVLQGRLPARIAPALVGLRAYVRAVLLYVALYYALWAFADAMIQGAKLDVAWLLRMLPNQLYYAWWVPVVFGAFFARRYWSTSASTQAPR